MPRRIVELVRGDDSWQELRKSFVGTWKKTAEDNLFRMAWWYDSKDRDEPSSQILMNYLTCSGFRSRGAVADPAVNRFRLAVQRRLDELGAKSIQMMPTHYCPTCDGVGDVKVMVAEEWLELPCKECDRKGIIPGKLVPKPSEGGS